MLSVENIDFYIGAVNILRGVSLRVREKEIVGLVGRNGAGKTSTIKNIIGLFRPRRGRIIYRGMDITKLPAAKRARLGIGYSPEDSRVYPELTVLENLMIPMWIRRVSRDVLDLVFDIFPEIKEFLDRKGQNLSGGQKKMVSIARALALDPDLLLLDEPFEGLSPAVVARFQRAIKRIRELGKTIIIASARINVLVGLADRVYVIERGEIIHEGSPDEIIQNEQLMRIIGR